MPSTTAQVLQAACELPIMCSLPDKLAAKWPAGRWRDCHVVVAVSGGADSVALLRALEDLHLQTSGSGKLVVAHFNHRLRGPHADRDETWVRALAAKAGLEVAIGHAEAAMALASEQQAREARYAFLLATAERLGARFVATAHTADDQVETVLMRVLRGSGIDGLAGIPFVRPLSASVSVVRPLLDVRRQEVEQYLAELQQDFRIDSTNDESHFTRNWIRGELLPAIRQRLTSDPDAALLRLCTQAVEWQAAMEVLAARLASKAVRVTPGDQPTEMVVDRELLAGEPAILAQQVCRHAWRNAGWAEQAMGMADWQQLAAAIAAPATAPFTTPFTLPGGIRVRGDSSSLVLAREAGPTARD